MSTKPCLKWNKISTKPCYVQICGTKKYVTKYVTKLIDKISTPLFQKYLNM
jgi:hypothetical protein